MTYRDGIEAAAERQAVAERQEEQRVKQDWKRCRICKKPLLPVDTLNSTCCDDCHLQERKDQAP